MHSKANKYCTSLSIYPHTHTHISYIFPIQKKQEPVYSSQRFGNCDYLFGSFNERMKAQIDTLPPATLTPCAACLPKDQSWASVDWQLIIPGSLKKEPSTQIQRNMGDISCFLFSLGPPDWDLSRDKVSLTRFTTEIKPLTHDQTAFKKLILINYFIKLLIYGT